MNTRSMLAALSILLLASGAFGLELPADLAARVLELAPGATVKKVKLKDRDGVQVYRVEVRYPDGRDGRIELTADGTLHSLKLDIPQDALPGPVADAAKKLWPGAEFDDAERHIRDDKEFYEADFRQDGRDLWAKFLPDGTVVEREDEIDVDRLPDAVLERLEDQHPGARITKAVRKLEDGREFVELGLETHFQLKLSQPEGAKTHLRRVKIDDLPDWARKSVEEATGGKQKGLRIVRKISEPVTVFEVEVKRRLKVEIDLKELKDNDQRAGKDGDKRGNAKRDRPEAATRKRRAGRAGRDEDVF